MSKHALSLFAAFVRGRGAAVAVIVAFALAACGQSANVTTLPSSGTPAAGVSAPHRARKARVTIRIRVPKKPHRRARRGRAHYISVATKGVSFAFTGTSAVTVAIALTPSDPRCSGSPLTCTISLTLVAGKYKATVSAYDRAPAKGGIPSGASLLSTARNVPVTVALGKANHFNITLDGVPASFAVTGLPTATAGTAFSSPQAFTVTANDADGYTIVGAYGNPVTLTDADTSGATTIATSGSDDPPNRKLLSSSDSATLNYTGLAIAPATIAARATGATGSAQFTPTLQPIVVTTRDAVNPSFAGVDFNAASGPGSSGTFGVSEVGWTNDPYDKSFTVTPGSGCGSIGSYVQTGSSSSGGSSSRYDGAEVFTATVAGSPSPGTCTALTLGDGVGQSQPIVFAYTNFAYTGAAQTITVPAGVATMLVTANGGSGGTPGGENPGIGGYAGSVAATLPIVAAGESLGVYVGGEGGAGGSSGGFNGGAAGSNAGNGGGASDIREGGTALANRILVAGGGGGGGGGESDPGGNGGSGGGAGTQSGEDGAAGGGADGGTGGGAGTGTGAGAGGTSDGAAGTLGDGGRGGSVGTVGGGGGGGGYYGGGGGGGASQAGQGGGGGGGGSSFAESTASSVTYSALTQDGDGSIVIIW